MNGPITTEETYHVSNILKHYAHAKEKHPYFCDGLLPEYYSREHTDRHLRGFRRELKDAVAYRGVVVPHILNCEIEEAYNAIIYGDTTNAVEECYDAIAVLLRTIDVLEGRQPLGKPQPISGNDAEK